MRGRRCPKALASLESERVCTKVCVNRNKSQSCSSREEGWKRGRNAQNPLCLSQGCIQVVYLRQRQSTHWVMLAPTQTDEAEAAAAGPVAGLGASAGNKHADEGCN